MEFFYQAFLELGSERPVGFSIGRIPVVSILHYARHYKLDGETESDLIYFVTTLDDAYLREINSK